jgi:endoglucanase
MLRLNFIGSLLALVGGIHLHGLVAPRGSTAANVPELPRRGVSLAGAEFGTQREDFCNETPGVYRRDYVYNHEATVQNFCQHGVRLLRIPVRWERLQPRLADELDAADLRRLRTLLAAVRKHDGSAILDVHNFGRYSLRHRGRVVDAVIDHPVDGSMLVSRQHFADLWSRLSEAFAHEPAVCAYGLMKEPHDMGHGDWKAISQAAVDAIRGRGDRKMILVCGNQWSGAQRFGEVNGPRAWVDDSANNVAYEAHCYFDHDGSGRYDWTYDQELARDPNLQGRALARLEPFVG